MNRFIKHFLFLALSIYIFLYTYAKPETTLRYSFSSAFLLYVMWFVYELFRNKQINNYQLKILLLMCFACIVSFGLFVIWVNYVI